MKKLLLAAVVLFLFALGGCNKAGSDDCQKAADNLKGKGHLGQAGAELMLQADGKHKCEGRFNKKQTKCLAGLSEVTQEAIAACE